MLVRRFASDDEWNRSERELAAGRQTLRDALARQTAYVRGSFADVYAFHVAEIAVDPSFAPFVERCEARGIAVGVVSSGIGPIVRARLRDAGLARLPVVAPEVDALPEGWRMRFADDSENGTDKARLVREAQARGGLVAYAGDGQSDFAAAAAADVRFAKRGRKLERYLTDRNLAFTTFSTFEEVTEF